LLHRLRAGQVIALGLVVIAVGSGAMTTVALVAWLVPVAAAVSGLGIGLSSVASTALGTDVPPDLQGTASGVLNTAAQLGTALGVAALLLVATTTADSGLFISGRQLAWAVAALTATASAAAVLHTGRTDRSPIDDPAASAERER
jgi:MFS family permease